MKAAILLAVLLITACNHAGPAKKNTGTTAEKLIVADSLPGQAAIKKLQDSLDIVNQVTGTEGLNKAYVSLNSGDSTISLHANIRENYRIFGYARPDTNAERLLLWSVFTNDVEGNPFRCKLGSYYASTGMKGLQIKYLGTEDDFIKAAAIDTSNNKTPVYFEKKWIDVE